MTSEYIHPVLGKIRLSRTLRSRRITISVNRNGEIRLSYPYFISRTKALAFIEDRTDWIQAARQRQQSHTKHKTLTEGYQTRRHTLRFAVASGNKITINVTTDDVIVAVPQNTTTESAEAQQAAREGLTEALRQEAKTTLPPLVKELAQQHGFKYNKITVKNIHSKWGSCSATNNLNFSLYLMLLPDELVRFVILHELCHTKIKNHSDRFHSLLEQLCGNEARFNKELKQFHTEF